MAGQRGRRRRPSARALIFTGIAGVIAATGLFVLALMISGDDDVRVDFGDLGDDVFRAGLADNLAGPIERDGPLLFQALVGGRDIFVQHIGSEAKDGWLAFDAQAPGAARECQLRWERSARRFRDPCSKRTFPASGKGLRAYPTYVDAQGFVVVELRRAS